MSIVTGIARTLVRWLHSRLNGVMIKCAPPLAESMTNNATCIWYALVRPWNHISKLSIIFMFQFFYIFVRIKFLIKFKFLFTFFKSKSIKVKGASSIRMIAKNICNNMFPHTVWISEIHREIAFYGVR